MIYAEAYRLYRLWYMTDEFGFCTFKFALTKHIAHPNCRIVKHLFNKSRVPPRNQNRTPNKEIYHHKKHKNYQN
ncbi:MAG: hypothetical protein LBJ00_03155 [Planctomycetaceae bacterium]|nr:hypothetical protein [Planctomycetaceae bacterium]